MMARTPLPRLTWELRLEDGERALLPELEPPMTTRARTHQHAGLRRGHHEESTAAVISASGRRRSGTAKLVIGWCRYPGDGPNLGRTVRHHGIERADVAGPPAFCARGRAGSRGACGVLLLQT